MTSVRRAGIGLTERGERVTWSVAEGRRGRRWREAVVGEGGLRHVLLLETDPDGRFTHLELATPAGLLTLHPEGDGTVHGNVVHPAGVRHVIGLPWPGDGGIVVAGSPIANAALALLLRNALATGASMRVTVLVVGPDLDPAPEQARIARLEADRWQVGGDAPFIVDAACLPILPDGAAWPMEAAPPG
jgi:hypothetical protein